MAVKTKIKVSDSRYERLAKQLAENGIPSEAVDVYSGRNRVVCLDTEDLGKLNIKAFKRPSFINSLVYTTLRHSKARRAYENAVRLRESGIHSPRPLAYVEVRNGLFLRDSYFVSIQLEGYQDVRVLPPDPLRSKIIDHMGFTLARMHRRHIWMKDFSQGNVLWREEPDGRVSISLVDINRMAFGVKSRKKLMKNFRSISNNTLSLRALVAAYVFHASADPDHTLKAAQKARASFRRFTKFKNRLRGRKF